MPPLSSGARAVSRWHHANVVVVIPSLPLWLTAKAKARRAGRGLAIAAHPASPSASRPSTCPAPPAAIRSRRRDPWGSPNPSRLGGESTPLSTHLHAGGQGEVGGRRWNWRPPVGTLSAAKTGAARGRIRTRRRQAHLPPLPPRRRTAVVFVFLPADEPHYLSSPTPALRPVATKVRTSFPLPFVDAPAFEPRGNVSPAPRRHRL
jgi:hypothetical protein